MRLRFRSFRARLLAFVLGLLLVVQAAGFLAVNAANERSARDHIHEALELTARAFQRTLDERERILLEKARLLSSDFAFKEAAATGEHGTILSALRNHSERVDASVMMLLSMEGEVVADTLRPEVDREAVPRRLGAVLDAAMDNEFGEATSIEFLDDTPHQLVVTPLFMPEPMAWIVIGFPVDDALAHELRESTGTQVSLLRRGPHGGWWPFASTLPPDARGDLVDRFSPELKEARRTLNLTLADSVYVSWLAPTESVLGTQVATLLQRSLDVALAPTRRLRAVLLGIFGIGLLLSLAGAVMLAARVTRPVAELAEGAERVARGDYTRPVEITQEDEMGLLATSFNRMTRGLAERDRVRDLLGKVVSPEVAEELLSKDIELGGEERVVTVLFSDVRNFTSLSEQIRPQELVGLLNGVLTRVSEIVEAHGGVVDKYIGDAVMAVFGAPLGYPDDALRAVRTALDLYGALDGINAELGLEGARRVGMGVGVATGVVVAGNMGSTTRLNYTVIGDSVNVASRLEGLTKSYGVGVIVGQSTRNACAGMAFRELDRVRVKGRREALAIHEPVGPEDALADPVRKELERWHEALERFRTRQWDAAERILEELARAHPGAQLYALYLERVVHLRADPPPPDWDGVTTFTRK